MPAKACEICGDTEPSHVHLEGRRIEGYFTVGRGQTEFEAAQYWHDRAIEAERALKAASGATPESAEPISSPKAPDLSPETEVEQ